MPNDLYISIDTYGTAAQTAAVAAASEAQTAADRAEEATQHPPVINETTGCWRVWNATNQEYEDTTQSSRGQDAAVINDTTTSDGSTWSSSKISAEITAASDCIDDMSSNTTNTWSGSKIASEIADAAGDSIDDSSTGNNTTWSSNKITSEIAGASGASINDSATGSSTTWSSNKINSAIAASAGSGSGGGGSTIDDTSINTTNTWSGSKINSTINANSGASIDDSGTSSGSTWSSNKINSTVNNAVAGVIDDTTTNNSKAWSGSKINSAIAAAVANSEGSGSLGAGIDDTITTNDSTWSSNKISSEIASAFGDSIDDTATANNSTWSSSKINSTVNDVVAGIIDDTSNNTTNTWSGSMIASEIAEIEPGASIDDSSSNTTNTWSGSKIASAIADAAGDSIDDTVTASGTTWSSNRISSSVNDAVASVIDDTSSNTTNAWSGSKIASVIADAAGDSIDDAVTASDSTWSGSKISTEIISGVAAIIDDTATDSSKVWSAEKVASEITAATSTPLVDYTLAKSYTGTVPMMRTDTSRGAITRINNPGRFKKIKVYAQCMNPYEGQADTATITAAIMNGDFVVPRTANGELGSTTSLAATTVYLIKASTPITTWGEFATYTIEFDTDVEVTGDRICVAIWVSTGTVYISLDREHLDTSVVAQTDEYPGYALWYRYIMSADWQVRNLESYQLATNAAAFSICSVREQENEVVETLVTDMESAQARIDDLEAINAAEANDDNQLEPLKPDGGYCAIFNSIACIGDSLTAGTFEHNNTTGFTSYEVIPNYSYPKFIERTLGCTVNVFAQGGATAKGTLTRIVNEGWIADNPSDCYIIALGTNDVEGTSPLTGDVADVNTTDMTLTDVTTDIGAYGKIIQLIRAQVPKSKVFIVTMSYARNIASQVTNSNVKLRALAEYLNCNVVDLGQYGVQYEGKYEYLTKYFIGGHLHVMGYKHLALMIMTGIDWTIRHNMADFAQVAFTQTNYEMVWISYTLEPQDITVTAGSITESLTAEATSSAGGTCTYEWLSNTRQSTSGGAVISGATGASMALDTTLTPGTYYYYCRARDGGYAYSRCAAVTVVQAG